jgi:hypothetical protein
MIAPAYCLQRAFQTQGGMEPILNSVVSLSEEMELKIRKTKVVSSQHFMKRELQKVFSRDPLSEFLSRNCTRSRM